MIRFPRPHWLDRVDGFSTTGKSRYEMRSFLPYLVGFQVLLLTPIVVVIFSSWGVIPGSSSPMSMVFVAPACAVMGIGVATVGAWRVDRRQRRAVFGTSGLACPNCLYDLRGRGVERCPECGFGVDPDKLPRRWARRYRRLRAHGDGAG